MSPCGNSDRGTYKITIGTYLVCDRIQKASDVKKARQNLQRTINSLVGLGGKGYKEDSEVGNPIDGMSGGAIIPHLKGLVRENPGAEEAVELAESALEHALKCLEKNDLAQIKRCAKLVCCLLQAARDAIES